MRNWEKLRLFRCQNVIQNTILKFLDREQVHR